MTLNIGLLTIATGKYLQFLDGLLGSAARYFLSAHRVTPFVFADQPVTLHGAVHLHVRHEPWPLVTLKRFHYFAEYAHALEGMDYLFYVDADMRFVSDCGDEILPGVLDRLVGVRHPAYYHGRRSPAAGVLDRLTRGRWSARQIRNRRLPFERDSHSLACLADSSYGHYFAGGFNGGYADSFLTMARTLRDAVDHDAANGITAVWHDESHLNRYFYVQKPKALTPAYCYPESGFPHLRHLKPVLLALDKDHGWFRDQQPHP